MNVNVRTYYAEGSKTLAFEVAEQLGWEAPDHVIVPVGSGSQLTKVAKGFTELHAVGLLDEEPHVRVSGAQAAGCSPVATAFAEGTDAIRPVKPHTIAKSLAIGNPADGWYALETVRRSGGAFAAVTDDEILDGIRLLGPHRGHLRRDSRRGDHRHAGQAGRARGRAPRRAGRGVCDWPRAQDGGGPRRHGGPHRHHRTHARSVPRGRRHRRHRAGASAVSVTVRVPAQLRTLTGGASQVTVDGSTVGEVLKALDGAHPGFGDRLFDEGGSLRRFVNVFLADEDVRFLEGLDTPVADGQTLSIVPAVAGG